MPRLGWSSTSGSEHPAEATGASGFHPGGMDLAQKVTHGDIDRVDAFAAVQATVLVIRTLQQLAL